MTQERHILGISGGRDSASLAVYMRQHHPELPLEYFFTDTGKELPEVYSFLDKLEGFLGKPIQRLNPDRGFDFCRRFTDTGEHNVRGLRPGFQRPTHFADTNRVKRRTAFEKRPQNMNVVATLD